MRDDDFDRPRGICPRCGDVYYDLDIRRGERIRCACGAYLRIVLPNEFERERTRLPD